MATIIVITAADGSEPQRETRLGENSVAWCVKYLELDDDPIALTESIVVWKDQNDRGGTKKVFVKVTADESGSVKPGFYPSGKNPSEVVELLRNEKG